MQKSTDSVVLSTILIVDIIQNQGYNILKEVRGVKNKNFDIWLGIGLNILHYRKEQGMTQLQLAEKANISKNHLQRIETAACSCTLDTLIDIAEALNIPLKKLFEFKD